MNNTIDNLIQLATSKDNSNNELFHLYYNWNDKEQAIDIIFNDIKNEVDKAIASNKNDYVGFARGYYLAGYSIFTEWINHKLNCVLYTDNTVFDQSYFSLKSVFNTLKEYIHKKHKEYHGE